MKTVLALSLALSMILVGCQRSSQVPAIGEYIPGVASYDRAFARTIKRWEIPGGALAVIDEGQILLARGYGLADVAHNEPVLPESLFRIASLSKPITAAAVLKLVEEDRLSLDTAAFTLLDDLEPPAGASVDPRIYDITIRHLLEHSAGWDASASFDPMFSSQRAAAGVDLPAAADCPTIIGFMLGRSLDYDPGSQYAYSNLGYCVLGRVIERVSGQTYPEYVQSQILAPIGIDTMRLGRSRLAERDPAEVRYYECGDPSPTQSVFLDGPARVPWPYGGFYLEAMDAHGGWIGSAVELARFVSGLEQGHPSPILGPETLELMLSRPEAPLWEGRSDYYALGWRVRPTRKGAAWWHTGSFPGSTAVLYRTASGLAWVALFNASPADDGGRFLADLISAMGRAALLSTIPWRYWPILAVPAGAGTAIAVLIRRKKRRARDAGAVWAEHAPSTALPSH